MLSKRILHFKIVYGYLEKCQLQLKNTYHSKTSTLYAQNLKIIRMLFVIVQYNLVNHN